MKIISLTRVKGPVGIPDTFVVGTKPYEDGAPVEESPNVSDIKYWDSSPSYVRMYNGPLYVVEFENSTVKRIIPKSAVIDVAIETRKEEEESLPGLSKLESSNA